ncbi:MAG: penicillin-binding protein 1A [Armatimonadota bacterium]|nr:penicillin-binding protein 1A [Armatimonadota bacterium]
MSMSGHTQRFSLTPPTRRVPHLRRGAGPRLPRGAGAWLRLAAVVAAAGGIVAVVATGVVAGMALAFSRHLPDVSTLYAPPSEATRVYAVTGEVIASLFRENREFVPLDEIPLSLRQAVIAIEDERFYRHRGVDVRGTLRALWRNLLAGEIREGGSTITQQLARAVFLTQKRVLSRKVAEMMLALEIERRLTKDEILERYLNQVYFGNGAYGVELASQVYFGKPARRLTLAESALLAGIIRAPSVYNPFRNLPQALERQQVVLRRMAELGYLTDEQAQAAREQPVRLAEERNAGLLGIRAPYFVSYILPALLRRYGEDAVYSGGLRVYTTVDPRLQAAAEKAVRAGLDEARRQNLRVSQGALVALDPATGAIRAMIGGYDFAQSQFNRAWQARRQPGSAFKPFIYATALARGIPPTRIIVDEPVTYEIRGTVRPEDRLWTPRNYDGTFRGPVTLRYALEHSINIPAIKTLAEVGPQAVIDTARRMGITSPLEPVLSLALGTNEVTPLEMASAYGALATLGIHAEPFGIVKVVDREGRVLEEHTPRRRLALSADVAYVLTDLLKGVILRGTGTAAQIGRPAAGKTGTTDDYRNAWFIGYTPRLVAAVWVGNDDNTPMRRVVGGTVPVRIWAAFMRVAVADLPAEDWAPPEGVVVATVCGTSGRLATSQCADPRREVFVRGTEPTEYDISPPPAEDTGPAGAAVPLTLTSPAQGQAVSSPFVIEGLTHPDAVVSLRVAVRGGGTSETTAETRIPVTNDGRFAYLFRPPLRQSGVRYVITVTATAPDGARATATLTVIER